MHNVNIAKRKSFHNENRSVPDVLPKLREAIAQLHPSPRNDYLRDVVFSKYADPSPGSATARRNAAIRKFVATEANNSATNVRLMTVCEDYQILPRVSFVTFMDRVRSIVASVIGEVPPGEILGSFSGGASTSRRRTESHPALKYAGLAHATPEFRECAEDIILESPIWLDASDGIQEFRGSVLFTVPKSSDIDRCACKEPDINMYAQKFYGDVIRRGLKRVGIDLRDQSRNRSLAALGSSDGNLATLDLSSASDSICTELVFQALPVVWFCALDACRSHSVLIDDEWVDLEMFSSMGNGFTFELESLLFYAIARAVAWCVGEKGVISVYGDDIICPSALARDLIWVLSFLGFETNTSKSFWEGGFRESCGGHYFNGNDVTPFYVKGPVSSLLELINLLNSIRRWSSRWGGPILESSLEDFWVWASGYVPKRFWGGHDTGDRSRLVSYPSGPGYRLTSITKTDNLGIGGYALRLDGYKEDQYWFNQLKVSSDLGSAEFRRIDTQRYRRKPACWLGEACIPFYSEVVCP